MTRGKAKVVGNLQYMSSYQGLNIHAEHWTRSWLYNEPFCSGSILITSCSCRKDIRLSRRIATYSCSWGACYEGADELIIVWNWCVLVAINNYNTHTYTHTYTYMCTHLHTQSCKVHQQWWRIWTWVETNRGNPGGGGLHSWLVGGTSYLFQDQDSWALHECTSAPLTTSSAKLMAWLCMRLSTVIPVPFSISFAGVVGQ